MLFFSQKDAPFLSVSPGEREEAIGKLVSATTLHKGYYVLLILSVLIVTAGLLMDNVAVIIGGMVIAPLLLPILTLSLSLVARSRSGIVHAIRVLCLSIVLTVALSYGVTRLAALTHIPTDRIPVDISPSLYFVVAFCSGIAAAFAWVKEDIAPAIAGIAIAVSLLPPLCAAGVALALPDISLASVSMRVFLLNAAGILLAAILVFVMLGFLRASKVTEKIVKDATGE